jgi:tetratricopeptide (TPR) repeat protein
MKYLILALFFISFPIWSQSNFDKAETCFKMGKYDQAKPLFEKLMKQNPADLRSIEYLADTYCHLKQWETAIPYYAKLKKAKPSEAEYCYKFGGAMAMLAKDSNKFKALSMIGDIRSAFVKTIALNPKHIGARWALIELYLQLPGIFGGSEAKAIRYSEQLIKISPVDGYLSRGHIEEYFGNYTNAEKQYKKAIDAGNSQTTSQKLADLYRNKMEQPEKAREVLAAFNEKNKS